MDRGENADDDAQGHGAQGHGAQGNGGVTLTASRLAAVVLPRPTTGARLDARARARALGPLIDASADTARIAGSLAWTRSPKLVLRQHPTRS